MNTTGRAPPKDVAGRSKTNWADSPQNGGSQPRQCVRNHGPGRDGPHAFGPGAARPDRRIFARDAKVPGVSRAQDGCGATPQDRHRPALHEHHAGRCRRADRYPDLGDRQPGQQIHARGLLGIVVRPLHGGGSPSEAGLRQVPRPGLRNIRRIAGQRQRQMARRHPRARHGLGAGQRPQRL